jgi:hypothetical protein
MTSWCYMYRCNGESVDHLLHCLLAGVLWNFVFCSLGIQWVLSGQVVDVLFGWRNIFGKHSSDVWNLVPCV